MPEHAKQPAQIDKQTARLFIWVTPEEKAALQAEAGDEPLTIYVKRLLMNQRQVTLHMTNQEYLLLLRKSHIRAGQYAVSKNLIESEVTQRLKKGKRAA